MEKKFQGINFLFTLTLTKLVIKVFFLIKMEDADFLMKNLV